jgi:FtsP/CotA-like multicopper oxidase with cupredoxin domain
VREYWIKAVRTPWDIVPTHHDGMMDSRANGPAAGVQRPVRAADHPRPQVPPARPRVLLCFHSFTPLATGLTNQFSCINGRAYAGNTPTLRAKVGETVAWHVFALDNDFHAFHLHGHRWLDPDGGMLVDNKTLGPADIISLQFVEDNPGRWFYHCHVFSHLHMVDERVVHRQPLTRLVRALGA